MSSHLLGRMLLFENLTSIFSLVKIAFIGDLVLAYAVEFLIQLIVVSWTNCIKLLDKVCANIRVGVIRVSKEAVNLRNTIYHLTFSLIFLIVNHLCHSPALFHSVQISLVLNILLIGSKILARIHLFLFLLVF